jgi:hypothetical protein
MRHDRTSTRRIAAAGALIVTIAACGGDGSGENVIDTTDTPTVGDATVECPVEGAAWEVAKLYVEHNATDEDTGVHGFFGGEAWSVLCLTDPNGTTILTADPLEQFDRLAVSDLFFESREPPNDEFPIDRIRDDFPAGDYTVAGIDVDGTARVGTATFTHAIPAPPTVVAPGLVADFEEADPPATPPTGLIVRWEAVTETIEGDPVTITGYEVIVTDEEADDPDGFARPEYDVHVPADQLSLTVPDDFVRPGTLYELEVLAIEDSGNQTITVGFFTTE